MHVHYFAYGTNMDVKHMRKLCSNPTLLGKGQLDGWEFGYNADGLATIRKNAGMFTIGAVWELDVRCIQMLDQYERLDINLYRRAQLTLRLKKENYDCITYIAQNSEKPSVKRSDHGQRIVQAAKALSICDDYISNYLVVDASLPEAK